MKLDFLTTALGRLKMGIHQQKLQRTSTTENQAFMIKRGSKEIPWGLTKGNKPRFFHTF